MRKIRGFTLIELLVAVAIFAILSAMGWKVFDYIAKVKEQNTGHETRLAALQEAYQQILRDSLQIAPLAATRNLQLEPALVLQNGRLSFSKVGVTDPLQQGLPPTERVEYQYRSDEQKLYRVKYGSIYQTGREQAQSSVLLDHVEQFELVVLNPEAQNVWPNPQINQNDRVQLQYLPKGIQIKLKVNDTDYEWIFALINTDYMQPEQTDPNPFVGNETS